MVLLGNLVDLKHYTTEGGVNVIYPKKNHLPNEQY